MWVARHEGAQGDGGQVVGAHAAERAAVAADGGADGVADEGVGHGSFCLDGVGRFALVEHDSDIHKPKSPPALTDFLLLALHLGTVPAACLQATENKKPRYQLDSRVSLSSMVGRA